MTLSFSAHSKIYPPGKIGCWSPASRFMKLECANQRLRFDVLRRLFLSGKPDHLIELRQKVKLRAGYFLQRRKLDYESILALMVFPIPGKKKLLDAFKKIDSKKPYAEVALERLNKSRTSFCAKNKRRIPYALREICQVKVYR